MLSSCSAVVTTAYVVIFSSHHIAATQPHVLAQLLWQTHARDNVISLITMSYILMTLLYINHCFSLSCSVSIKPADYTDALPSRFTTNSYAVVILWK
ncbi:hypothetical protein BDZ91DRAFT_373612 [Kalaharituber pfeilii]|nr:hypothetical protein BDZ91DRAFT_373612 [Kalaharituber pfeilii]